MRPIYKIRTIVVLEYEIYEILPAEVTIPSHISLWQKY